MSPDEITSIESILRKRFHGAKSALTAAWNEVCLATTFPEMAEAVRAEVSPSLPLAEAVLQHATRRGEIQISLIRTRG